MTSKLVVNTIEADTGISSVSFASSISMSSTSKFHFSNAGIDIGADTNINRPAAGVLGFNINSSEKIRINSSGQVGIGTNSPKLLLHLHQENSNASFAHFTNTATGVNANQGVSFGLDSNEDATIYHYGSKAIRFATGGTEKARIDSAGNMSLGKGADASTAYTRQLQIHSTDTSGAALHLTNSTSGSGNSDGFHLVQQSHIYYWLREDAHQIFATNGVERLRIDSSGRLLIGTTTEGVSTADDLTIATSGSTGITIRSGSGNAGNIAFSDGTSGDDEIRGLIQYHHNDNVMKLFTNATERFRITSGGTVGINQSSPDSNSKLDVMSDATGTTVNSNRVALFRTNGGGRDAHITLSNSSNTPVHIGQLSSNLYFTTNNQERVRIASDGEVFIGTGLGSGNRSTLLSIAGANQNPSGVWTQVGVYSDDSQAANKGGSIGFGGQDGSTPKQQFAAIKGAKENSTSGNYAGYMAFYTRPAGAVSQERLRITSAGHVLFNCTSLPSTSVAGAGFEKNGSQAILFSSSGSSTASSNHAEFINGNGVVGRINTNGSSTTYYTSSDYRLKENQVAISDGITRLKSLKPYRFNFKADSTKTVDGFFAHEVSPVVPEAIGGEKDAVDSDNNPVYQDIDQSKLVPLLTAALQEAITEIETLKTKVAALEGS